MRSKRFSRRAALAAALLYALACHSSSRDSGNPVQPISNPSITSIGPAGAAPGEPIEIRGQSLAGEVITVSFDGFAGRLLSATEDLVEAVIPEVAPGERSVVMSVDGRSSQPFLYRVAAAGPPAIVALQPSRVHVGDRIVITGSHLAGRSPQHVVVGGVNAFLESWTPTRIAAFVPVLPPGVTNLRVIAGAWQSSDMPIEILHSRPVITAVFANPTRAGLWVTIRGAYLAGEDVSVLVDGAPVEHGAGASAAELRARIPAVDVGTHSLQVSVDGDLTVPYTLTTDDFDASGIYDVSAVVVRSRNGYAGGCPVPAVGTRRNGTLEIVDTRPDLVARFGSDLREYRGAVDSGGRITSRTMGVPGFPFPSSIAPIQGQVTRRADGRLEIDVRVVRVFDLLCVFEEHATGARRQVPSPSGTLPGE